MRPVVSLKTLVYYHYTVYTATSDGLPCFTGITKFMLPPTPEQKVSIADGLQKWLRHWCRQTWWERGFVDYWDSPGNAHSPYLTTAPTEVGTAENHLGVHRATSLVCIIPQGLHWRIYFPQPSQPVECQTGFLFLHGYLPKNLGRAGFRTAALSLRLLNVGWFILKVISLGSILKFAFTSAD